MHNPTLANLAVPWDGDRDDTLVCRAVRQETHDVRTFVFSAPEPRLFRYAPGQFITLELEIGGQAIQRCYTLSSTPSRPDTVSITVKRVPGGPVSNWLHDNLEAGSRIKVRGPAGAFSCFLQPMPEKRKYLFLSAGSGITPLMSMARAMHDLVLDADIAFVHSARTPDDIIFARELDLIASNHKNFRTSFVCERIGARTSWPGVTGFLSLPLLKLIAPDFLEREVFTCGPAPYMKAVRDLLDEGGFDRKHYHEESFSFGVVEEVAAELTTAHVADALATQTDFVEAREEAAGFEPAPIEPIETIETIEVAPVETRFKVSFAKSRRDIECGSGEHVLDAAKKAGVRLPSSCTQGMCGTCKVKLVSGEVSMKHAGGIRQREIDQGMVLLCCSKPLSDLVVDK
jgi:ferredoxin-NADP reductase